MGKLTSLRIKCFQILHEVETSFKQEILSICTKSQIYVKKYLDSSIEKTKKENKLNIFYNQRWICGLAFEEGNGDW